MQDIVLVLNANYEPIHVCNLRRALGLILVGKADLILNGSGEVHTARAAYPKPSIIRLQKMVIRPRPHVLFSRREIFRRDDFTCQYCGKSTDDLTIDHIVPRHLGGAHTWTNVVTACYSCNHRKGGRTLKEAEIYLLHQPKEPPQSAQYVFSRYLSEKEEWEPFLNNW